MTPEVKDRVEQIRRGNVPKGYKTVKMGIAPLGWTNACLGDIYTERKEPGNERLPLLMVSIHSGVSDGEVDEEDLPKKVKRIEDKSQYKRAAKGDLVFNMMRAWQGAIGTVCTEGMVSPAYIVAKPNNMVEPLFMNYYMKSKRMVHTIRRKSYGVTDFRLRLYWDSFAPIPCVLPSVKEQKRIAEILTSQDRIIELEQRKIEEIEKMKRYFLSKMFPKKGQRVPEIRFKGFTDDWEQRKFDEVFDCSIPNNTLSRAELSYDEGNVLNIHYGDVLIKYGSVLDVQKNAIPRIPQKDRDDFKGALLQDGDVIIADTAEDETTGKACEIGNLQGAAIVSGLHTMVCRPRNQMALGYLGYYLNADTYHRQLLPLMQGIKVLSLSRSNIQKTVVSYPAALKEQQLIADYFNQFDRLITLHQRKCEELQKQKKALMQLLLTGIVRVNV